MRAALAVLTVLVLGAAACEPAPSVHPGVPASVHAGVTVAALTRAGTTVVLTVRVTAGTDPVAASTWFSRYGTTAYDGGRLLDGTSRRVWATATRAADDPRCVCTLARDLGAGESAQLQAAFTGVPAAVTRMSVLLPGRGVVTGVPVRNGPPPLPPHGLALDLTTVFASESGELSSYRERLDTAMTIRGTPQHAELTLDADVLFTPGTANLTPAATGLITAASEAVTGPSDSAAAVAVAGELTVTGHTDDTGPAARNRELSRERAAVVADAITPKRPITVVGEGERLWAVPNTDAVSRHLNRRVTIGYRPGPPSPAPPVPLPDTTGVRGTGPTGVTVTLPDDGGDVAFVPSTVGVVGDALLVGLVARNVGDRDVVLAGLLGARPALARGDVDPGGTSGSAGIRLLDGTTASYPLDYRAPAGDWTCLCERDLTRPIPPGGERALPLWFPRPATSVTAVTVDLPGLFRITDIPIG
ncbi:OmpA family protein [Actinoplanes sp. NPDC051494]|uniref:OmpA family protein n=1 Tax=Actinoplanes sp. NPDC051494 TaxID=3363907 RepID=UPI0037A00B61